ncbi:MAG: hypothetical protein HGA36_00725 [Candidatus Moranbacteria bacterium]|nr:hypothetical protein [Candidatus Moranbacteria bacterium]
MSKSEEPGIVGHSQYNIPGAKEGFFCFTCFLLRARFAAEIHGCSLGPHCRSLRLQEKTGETKKILHMIQYYT